MKSLSKVFIFSLLLTFSISLAHTQTIPTGKLDGYVNDDNNLALPGASVMISSPSLITPQMECPCNEQGYFRFIGLPSGIYKVTFEMPGFKSIVREGIGVTAGRSTRLNITLEQSTLEETIVVEGEAPLIDVQNTATGMTFTQQALEELPVARTVADVSNLAPGMENNASHGSDILTNKTTIDGMIQTNPLHGVIVNEVGFTSIEEITIDTTMHKAEHGGVKGAVVQIITKSGGNEFHGEAGIFMQEASFQSDNTAGTPFEGQFVGFDYEYQPYISFGGPLMKDKVWFFASFDMRLYQYFTEGYPYDKTQNTGRQLNRYKPFGKVTWQLSPSSKVVAGFSYYKESQNHYGAGWNKKEDGTMTRPGDGASYSLQWSKTFSTDLLSSFRIGYWNNYEERIAKSQAQQIYEDSTRLYSGGASYTHPNVRDRVQLFTDTTYFIDDWNGSHEIKIGGNVDYSWNNAIREYHQDPMFDGRYPSGFKVYRVYTDDGVPYRLRVRQSYNRKENVLNAAFFVQDTWSPSKRFVFSFGARYDYSKQIWPAQKRVGTDEWLYESSVSPFRWSNISPRLGITYDLSGNGRTVLKASYGRYYAGLTTMLSNHAHQGWPSNFDVRVNPDYSTIYEYGWFIPTGELDPDGVSAYYNDELNFGIEQELVKDLSFSAMFIQKWEKNWVEDVDINHIDVADLKANGIWEREPEWFDYTPVQGIDPDTGNTVTYYSVSPDNSSFSMMAINIPGKMREYRALELKLKKRMSNNWALDVSYVWGWAKSLLDYSQLPSDSAWGTFNEPHIHVNSWGEVPAQRQHVLKLQGHFIAPLGIRLSTSCFFMSGRPYGRLLRSSEAGASLYQGRKTILVEPVGTYHLPAIYDISLRVEKGFRVGTGELSVIGDVFNLLNLNTTTQVGTTTARDWLDVRSIMDPRYFRLGFSYKF